MNNNFQPLSPSELDTIYAGGFIDSVKNAWNSMIESIQDGFDSFSQGVYDATGCGGKHG